MFAFDLNVSGTKCAISSQSIHRSVSDSKLVVAGATKGGLSM